MCWICWGLGIIAKPLQWIGADELLTSQSGFQDYVVGMKSLTWKMSKCSIDQEVSQLVSPQSMSNWAWAKDFGPISPELSLETSCKCTVDYSTSHLFSSLLFVMTGSGQCSCRYVFFSTPIVETKSFIDGGHLQKKCFSSRRLGRLLHHGDKVWKTLQSLG